jgi:small subunit ribosomal protein S1
VRTYNVGDVLEGKVTKVVSFGAFVEIMEGVEGLVHISELAQHHVENPREVVEPEDNVKVKILEIDEERRRLSLSLKRVEGQVLPRRELAPVEPVDDQEVGEQDVPDLGLSDEVFTSVAEEPEAEAETPTEAEAQPAEPVAEEPVAEEPVAEEPVAEEPVAEEPAAEEPAAEEPEEPAAEEEQAAPAAEAVEPEPQADEQT